MHTRLTPIAFAAASFLAIEGGVRRDQAR